jgi:hypothetical protein
MEKIVNSIARKLFNLIVSKTRDNYREDYSENITEDGSVIHYTTDVLMVDTFTCDPDYEIQIFKFKDRTEIIIGLENLANPARAIKLICTKDDEFKIQYACCVEDGGESFLEVKRDGETRSLYNPNYLHFMGIEDIDADDDKRYYTRIINNYINFLYNLAEANTDYTQGKFEDEEEYERIRMEKEKTNSKCIDIDEIADRFDKELFEITDFEKAIHLHEKYNSWTNFDEIHQKYFPAGTMYTMKAEMVAEPVEVDVYASSFDAYKEFKERVDNITDSMIRCMQECDQNLYSRIIGSAIISEGVWLNGNELGDIAESLNKDGEWIKLNIKNQFKLPKKSANGFTYLFEISVCNGKTTYKPKFRFNSLKIGDKSYQIDAGVPPILIQGYSENMTNHEFLDDEEKD